MSFWGSFLPLLQDLKTAIFNKEREEEADQTFWKFEACSSGIFSSNQIPLFQTSNDRKDFGAKKEIERRISSSNFQHL